MKNKNIFVSVILNIIIALSSLIGVIFSIAGSDSFMERTRSLLYYTIQSNIFSMIVSVIFIVYLLLSVYGKIKTIPDLLYYVKFVTTSGIILTLLVFWVFLSPTVQPAYFISVSNITLHTLSPVLCILDFIIFSPELKYNFKKIMGGIIIPIYYLVFVLLCVFYAIPFSDNAIVPYFFLDFKNLGWFRISAGGIGVIYWIIVISAIAVLIAYCLKLLNNLANKKSKNYTKSIDFMI